MSKYLKTLLFAIFFSFCWGLWWGLYNLEKSNPTFKKGPEVRVLTSRGFFSSDFLQEIETKYQVNFVLTEKDNDGDLLREALSDSKNYDLIQISSFIAKSFLTETVFQPLDVGQVDNFKNVSVDFKNLDFDPSNSYFIPLTWGLNGFVFNSKKVSIADESLAGILDSQIEFSILPSPVEMLSVFAKVKPIVKNWVETGQTAELAADLKDIRRKFKNLNEDPRADLLSEKLNLGQISSGKAAAIIQNNSLMRYILAEEGATLWVNLIGISRGAKDVARIYNVLNLLLRADVHKSFIESNEQATTLTSLNDSHLPEMQKARFIRQVPLSRVQLYINNEALEPIWTQAIKKEWPETIFK